MDNLPQDLKPGADYSLFISEKDSKWIETEKAEKRSEIVANSVGAFRNDLRKLKTLRRELAVTRDNELIKAYEPLASNKVTIDITEDDVLTKSIETNNKTFVKPPPLTLTLTPSNPLIDQTVKIIKPTEWIDCISRESKRVFVNDNWIVARILLPPVSKDSIGLKRLTLE